MSEGPIIKNQEFNEETQELIVTVKPRSKFFSGDLETETFGHDEIPKIRWKLIFQSITDGSDIFLEPIIGDHSKFRFVVDVPDSKSIQVPLKNFPSFAEDDLVPKIRIGRLHAFEPFDIKIRYLDQDPKKDVVEDQLDINRPVRGQFCDVQFNVGSDTIGFYKILLARKSDVFETMFLSPVTDPLRINDPIEIKDASATGFTAFLDVVYDGRSPEDVDVCIEVIAIAEKYNCDYVKQIVGDNLKKMIGRENAIKILMASDEFKLQQLKEEVLKFLREIPACELPDAKMMAANPELMLEVMKISVANKK